jgi:hypothetical protein
LRSARGGRVGGATLAVAVVRRRGCVGRFAPPPDVGRALRGAAVPGRAAALRGAAVRRLADDGAAGFRAEPFGAEPFAVVPSVAEPFAVAPVVAEPFVAVPDGFFGTALLLPGGVVPLAPFAPEELAPEPVRGVDDARAPEPRAEPEGRAGRREEGMR